MAFKAKVALEALREDATVPGTGECHERHPNRSMLEEAGLDAASPFARGAGGGGGGDGEREREGRIVYANIGKLTVERDLARRPGR